MNGDIAKKIFANFLKENKLIGIALVYFFGKPNYSFDKMSSNSKLLNKSAMLADSSKVDDQIKRHLIDMVGYTREPSVMFVRFKHDYMYEIYILWKKYIKENWNTIYEKYYKKIND